MEQSTAPAKFTFWKLMTVVVLAIAAVWIIFSVVGVLAGFVWTVAKLAVAIVILFVVVKYFMRKKPDSAE